VLQAQVEPHFLFNTLASVRSLIPADPGRAQSTIDALVDYLRATIPRLRDDAAQADSGISSTLGQQLEICESYLRLMQVRMGDRLSYQIDVPAGERATSFPPLLLITLVENAVKHGIEPRPGPGRIVIRIVRQAGRLTVTVQDDGQGLRDGFGTGVGLGNVREQLLVRYGERARVTLSGAAGGGTVASIVIADEDRA
jgi:sensor histidine kinase YesM